MDVKDTREQLEIVEKILAASSRTLCAGGEFFLVWGIVSASIDFLNQLVANNTLPATALWAMPVLILIGVVFSTWRSIQMRAHSGRMSMLQREYLNMMYMTLGVTFVAQFAGSNFFAGWAEGAIWNVAGAMVLLFIGMHGNRRAVLAGVVLIVTLAIANYTPAIAGYVLGAGMLVGYTGFGATELLARE